MIVSKEAGKSQRRNWTLNDLWRAYRQLICHPGGPQLNMLCMGAWVARLALGSVPCAVARICHSALERRSG